MKTQTSLNPILEERHHRLANHPLYDQMTGLTQLHLFMESHIFAVWDFMSLLKTLQRALTCVEVPWRPAPVPKKLTRLINEIVLGEESDIDENGEVMDHFSLYLEAMKEVGADTTAIHRFLQDFDYDQLRPAVAQFVQFNLNLCSEGAIHEVAAAFFWGREKLIPEMFDGLLNELEKNKNCTDKLGYYIRRHIELDGDEHGHLAAECLEILCENDPAKWESAQRVGLRSLELRSLLWDDVLLQIRQR